MFVRVGFSLSFVLEYFLSSFCGSFDIRSFVDSLMPQEFDFRDRVCSPAGAQVFLFFELPVQNRRPQTMFVVLLAAILELDFVVGACNDGAGSGTLIQDGDNCANAKGPALG